MPALSGIYACFFIICFTISPILILSIFEKNKLMHKYYFLQLHNLYRYHMNGVTYMYECSFVIFLHKWNNYIYVKKVLFTDTASSKKFSNKKMTELTSSGHYKTLSIFSSAQSSLFLVLLPHTYLLQYYRPMCQDVEGAVVSFPQASPVEAILQPYDCDAWLHVLPA